MKASPDDARRAGRGRFRQGQVTTIIQPGGLEQQLSESGTQQGYLPEVILLGDGTNDHVGAGGDRTPPSTTRCGRS